jgi:hypothetical protein
MNKDEARNQINELFEILQSHHIDPGIFLSAAFTTLLRMEGPEGMVKILDSISTMLKNGKSNLNAENFGVHIGTLRNEPGDDIPGISFDC